MKERWTDIERERKREKDLYEREQNKEKEILE